MVEIHINFELDKSAMRRNLFTCKGAKSFFIKTVVSPLILRLDT
jgi:hypothetical protein